MTAIEVEYIGRERTLEERVAAIEAVIRANPKLVTICPPRNADNSIHDTVTARSKRRGKVSA